ncbi:unnamed protein product, partial [Mesorhabditis belari]|uniref:Dynactin subunit 6 n=1 Tax=Mesorhabditis belari TaxID=2138241 RepID=A0AAF3FEG8_9BILA
MEQKKDITILPGDPAALVVETSNLSGKIKFSSGCIVHPTASIKATNGPIEFGESNLIEEQVVIENLSEDPLIIGPNNHFEIGCVIHASSVGKNNVFGVRSIVETGAKITDGCSIGPKCLVKPFEKLSPRTVLCGNLNCERRSNDDPPSIASQMDHLRLVIPKYNKIIK